MLKKLFPDSLYYNLLLHNEFARFIRNPGLLSQEVVANQLPGPVIIDEIQRVPELLNEVHHLIVSQNSQFILCGSSARKLKRGGGNLLGGRAYRYSLFSLVSAEIPDLDLIRAINHGLLPRHYLSPQPKKMLQAYVDDYLKEEIAAEALVRNVTLFSRFLEVAAICNGEIINMAKIASECGMSAPTVKAYFEILVDTMIGRFLPAFQRRPKRRLIQAPKFYFFDVGVINHLLRRSKIEAGTELFGRAFEHFIYQELMACSQCSAQEFYLSYWRTASGFEVDFIIDDALVAIEVKGTSEVQTHHLKGLKAFAEEHKTKMLIVVSLDNNPRKMGAIHILPWKYFLNWLWNGRQEL